MSTWENNWTNELKNGDFSRAKEGILWAKNLKPSDHPFYQFYHIDESKKVDQIQQELRNYSIKGIEYV